MSELACKPFGAWRVGDTVRCVDANSSADHRLVYGSTYTIASMDAEYFRISIAGVPGYWNHERFELVPEAVEVYHAPAVVAEPNPYADWKSGDSVRCDDELCANGLLHSQHVYEIEQIDHESKLVSLVGVPKRWGVARFERVTPIVDVHSEPDKPVVRVGSRVRCDYAMNSQSDLGDDQIYVVSAVDTTGRYIAVDGSSNPYWLMSRFTLLPDEVAPVVPAAQEDLADAVLMPADHARQLADAHFMTHGRELRLEIKAAIDAAVANGEYRANVHMSDSVYGAAQRWLAKSEYRLSSGDPGFTRRTISWQ